MSRHDCPNCGSVFEDGVTLTGVTIVGARTNIQVTCPACNHQFEGAPGGDGTFSTIGGRIHRIATFVAGADRDVLEALKNDLQLAVKERDQARAEVALAAAGWMPPKDGKSRRSMSLAEQRIWQITPLLLAVILWVLSQKGQVSAADVERIFRAELARHQAVSPTSVPAPLIGPAMPASDVAPTPSTSPPRRNAPCECGSGHKFKYCHGAPEGLSRAEGQHRKANGAAEP
jgi:hypothetical protein